MHHIIRETITLIRIERWLLHDDSAEPSAPEQVAEQVVEEIVLSGSTAVQVREVLLRIFAEYLGDDSD